MIGKEKFESELRDLITRENKRRKVGLYVILWHAERIVRDMRREKFLSKCKAKFSTCLDCEFHNHCERYKKHREGMK
jgi:uncharacterized protein YlbG (UPF0298 family)